MKHTNRTHTSRRRRHRARIHLLAKELGLTETAYRNVLAEPAPTYQNLGTC
jgi:hypothetical protein